MVHPLAVQQAPPGQLAAQLLPSPWYMPPALLQLVLLSTEQVPFGRQQAPATPGTMDRTDPSMMLAVLKLHCSAAVPLIWYPMVALMPLSIVGSPKLTSW